MTKTIRKYDVDGSYVELDARHRVGKEFAGKAKASWVFRFCDDFVSQHENRAEAVKAALAYEIARVARMLA